MFGSLGRTRTESMVMAIQELRDAGVLKVFSHGEPSEGMECMSCMDEIDKDNYVEYQAELGTEWLPSKFCEDCVKYLLDSQWQQYCDAVLNPTCLAEQRRLVIQGPPIKLRDDHALPCPNKQEVQMLWYSRDQEQHSSKLKGSLTEKERRKFWKHVKEFFKHAADNSDSVPEPIVEKKMLIPSSDKNKKSKLPAKTAHLVLISKPKKDPKLKEKNENIKNLVSQLPDDDDENDDDFFAAVEEIDKQYSSLEEMPPAVRHERIASRGRFLNIDDPLEEESELGW